ncbi:type I glyceraldehyde-3-phosphate dehydrogenase [Patescibacteria group bacterium]|nr:type I glyceraldehyde-3-phosphate dehydrogenase [Patescibacteria group bacterium]MBU1015726.1 type I glyceraldehyde-3-phosphate dehydrogenase [Patescibacteria group bacterium]MBU1684898.1 type I glyceraldehyde-3-phosphate dehydrogenase [Patescibacteria group bacterium]MBU1938644.1 type I glyceraldehyde-3-phosphate dehydrogenase [Patescibacteria group bacterium]
MKIAINGFGRIGRQILHRIMQTDSNLEVVAINDLSDPAMLALLFEFDSTYGRYPGTVELKGNEMVVDGKAIKMFAEKDPTQLPWSKLGVDLVMECTGVFRTKEKAGFHIKAGAKKVIISAPAKGEEGPDATIVMGCNEEILTGKEQILSNASCTTNCLAPFAKALNDAFGIKRGIMTTIHAVTASQRVLDAPDKDARRARSCMQNLIPTTTGAAKAVGLVIPALKGKLTGMAVRVPTPTVSLVDLTIELEKDVTVEEVNEALRKRAAEIPTILKVEDRPLVSKDFQMDSHSSIVDAQSTMVMEGNMVKVLSWYDNEWGYSCRMVDLASYIAGK